MITTADRDLRGNASRPLVCLLLLIALSLLTPSSAQVSASLSQEDPARYRPQIAIAEHELDAGNFAGAVSSLSRLVQLDTHSGPDVYRLLALAQFKQNDAHEAIVTCENGIVIYPHSAPLAALYVSILPNAVPAKDVPSHIETALQWAPDSPVLVKALGEDLLAANSTDPQAMQMLSRAAQLSPRDAEAHFFYGESACFNQSDDVCIKELRRAHELEPRNQQANMQLFTMIAVAEDKQNQPEQAEADFALAMKANRMLPKPSAYGALKYVQFLTAQNKSDQAIGVLDEILRWEPAYGPAHFERAKQFSSKGERQAAVNEAQIALEYPQSTLDELRSYHAFLARILFSLGRQQEAEVHQNWIQAHQQPGQP